MSKLAVDSSAAATTPRSEHRGDTLPAPPIRRKIKAVHLLHSIAYGGVETILINWLKRVRAIPDAGIELSLVCFSNPGQTEEPFLLAARKEGLEVRTLPWSRRKPILSSGIKLARILRSEQADVVHTHNTYADLTGLVAAKLARVKAVSSVYV